jgi:DnaA family protein
MHGACVMRQLVLELSPPAAPTLENFFPGPNAAALAALRHALGGGEPIVYLWGERGSGRTHLLRAVVAATRSQGRSSLYVPAPHAGLSACAGANLLAVDDVERLDGAAQTLLFDAYNSMRAAEGRLVAAGAMPVADLPLREDLRTRLGAGLSLHLAPLEDADKAAALSAHAASRGMRLGQDIIGYVLTHCRRDMSMQMAILDALDRHSLEHKRPVTIPLLRQALAALEP